MGCDDISIETVLCFIPFLLTHPVWDVTKSPYEINKYCRFLLTHPVWDVTEFGFTQPVIIDISTHTSRVGCDVNEQEVETVDAISTHTSRVGCDCYI